MEELSLDLTILIPAYNEDKVIGEVVTRVQDVLSKLSYQYEILVVNDGSDDGTAKVAEQAGARVVSHPENIGNGAAVKTGIRNARGKYILLMDGDGQHPPEVIPSLLEEMGSYDMVVAARTSGSETSIHRNLANRVYNSLATYVSGRKIDDLTSGFRVIKTDIVRGYVYLLPNTFSYPATITLALLRSGRSLLYIPFESKKRVGKSKIKLIRDGVRFLLIIMRISTYYSPLKIFIPISLLMFLLGFGYGLFKVIILNTRYGPTSAMLMTMSVVVFSVGLVSEQVAQLRYHWSEGMRDSQISDD